MPISDELRESLFTAYFGNRASEAVYDELNDMWTLSNSSAIGDYYLYGTTYPAAGETISGEESFSLEYRAVDLYPFEDNLLASVSDSTIQMPLEDVISMCGLIVDSIADLDEYTVDYVHAYGTAGRRPYYKIFYKRTMDGMPVTAYNDLYFLVDNSGIEKVFGSLYAAEESGLQTPIISLDDALSILSNNISQIVFEESSTMQIGKITLEYLVRKTITEEGYITPIWRFWLGDTDDQMNLMREKILAVDAVTGELIQEERGNTF